MSATESEELAEDPHEVGARTGRNLLERSSGGDQFAELFDCLSRRGGAGRRAQDFLESARWLLGADAAGLACRGEAVAYCVREAAGSILKSAGPVTVDSPWKDLSQRVVDARYRYDQAVRFPGEGSSEAALADLLGEIDALEEFKLEWPTLNEVRAAEVNARLTGSPAQRGDLAPMFEFLGVHERASDLLHSRCPVEEAERLLGECVDSMLGLLRSPSDREAQLAEVAARACPGDDDLAEALRRIGTDRDLDVFLDRVCDPAWLALLNRDGRLDPPGGGDGRWAAHKAAVRLSASHSQQVTDWLVSIAEQRPGDRDWCAAVVGALLNMENPDIGLALRFAGRHHDSGHILWFFRRALEDTDPSDEIVLECADVFLNNLAAEEGRAAASGWDHMPWDLMALLRMVAEGAGEANAADRVEMLLRKLERIPQRYGDLGIYPIGRDRQLSISALLGCDLDGNAAYDEDPGHALGGCLVSIMGKAMAWLPAAELLDLAGFAPEGLAGRLRTWILAEAPDADPDAMAAEIEQAITSRRPNCDDIALIDSVARDAGLHDYCDRWKAALGDPPTQAEARQAPEPGSLLPQRWFYPYLWSPLLPEPAGQAWAGAPGPQALADVIGAPENRGYYLGLADDPDSEVRAGWVQSPLSAEHLRGAGPEQAAAEIAAWRRQPHDWGHNYQVLAQTLGQVVGEDPDDWLADPLKIAETLHHPTYISSYLRGAARAASENPDAFETVPVAELVDAIALAQSEPWPAEPLDRDSRPVVDYDADWADARRAGTDLAKALIKSGIGLGGRDDDVWDYLEAEARANPDIYDADLVGLAFVDDPVGHMLENAGERNTAADPLQMAINQAGTLAVDAALSFVAAEHRATQQVRPGAVELIEWCLQQPGLEGAKHRAIIAPAAGLLHHVIPDWFDQNHSLLFGGEAPGKLGQLSVDLAVKWSQPWVWLLVNYRDSIYDSATRGADRSLQWLMAAMLGRIDGYKPQRTAQRLGERIPQACGALARLIDHVERTPDQMEALTGFCYAVIDYRNGRHATAMGQLAYADSLDHSTWEAITLKALHKTGGRIGQSHAIAKRILDNPPTPEGASILTRLVEVQTNPARPQTGNRHDGHRDGTWPRRLIADGTADWLNTAQHREPGDEYSRLEAMLADHGLLASTGSPEEA